MGKSVRETVHDRHHAGGEEDYFSSNDRETSQQEEGSHDERTPHQAAPALLATDTSSNVAAAWPGLTYPAAIGAASRQIPFPLAPVPSSAAYSSSFQEQANQQQHPVSMRSSGDDFLGAHGFQDSEDSFPFRLHRLLQDAMQYGFDASIVSWIQGGIAFIIHDRDQFSRQILPLYFSTTQFRSFQRQINLYQFERIRGGTCAGAYFHRYFRRDNRKLCHLITRSTTVSPGKGRKGARASTSSTTTTTSSGGTNKVEVANDDSRQPAAVFPGGEDAKKVEERVPGGATPIITPIGNNITFDNESASAGASMTRTMLLAMAGRAPPTSPQLQGVIQPMSHRNDSLISLPMLGLPLLNNNNNNNNNNTWQQGNDEQQTTTTAEPAASRHVWSLDFLQGQQHASSPASAAANSWMRQHEVDLSQFAKSLVASTRDHAGGDNDPYHFFGHCGPQSLSRTSNAALSSYYSIPSAEVQNPPSVLASAPSPTLLPTRTYMAMPSRLTPGGRHQEQDELLVDDTDQEGRILASDEFPGATPRVSSTAAAEDPAGALEDSSPDSVTTITHEILSTFFTSSRERDDHGS